MTQSNFKSMLFLGLFFISLLLSLGLNRPVLAFRNIVFPVLGESSYINDYGFPRDGGARKHTGIDIIAAKRQPLVAVVNGTITDVQYPMPDWGYSVTIQDSEGYKYRYIHMNDDNPGTNDGQGGGMNAYAADVKEGNRVVKGQLIGRVGDSGHANGISHLHFEIFKPDDSFGNPYESLNHATRISEPKNYPELPIETLPSGNTFKSRISLDIGNFDIDLNPEIVTGAGRGGKYVKILETNGDQIARFAPSGQSFTGGHDVAAGNVDLDPLNEIITGSGPGGSYVKVFEADGTFRNRFAPYGTGFKGGIYVAAGDVDNDGIDEIITGTGRGGGPRVSVFEQDGTPINSFYAYSSEFKGGVDVASDDVSGSSADEIITGAGPGGGPHVAIWQSNGVAIDDFYPYSREFKGGVRVAAGNVRTGTNKSEILSVPFTRGNPTIRMYDASGAQISGYFFMEQWWEGFNDVAAYSGLSEAGTGVNRRDSIRAGIE